MEEKMYEYDGRIVCVPERGGAYVAFPWDVRTEFGEVRMKVHATFDGMPYDTTCGSGAFCACVN